MLYMSIKSEIHPPPCHFDYKLGIISDQLLFSGIDQSLSLVDGLKYVDVNEELKFL